MGGGSYSYEASTSRSIKYAKEDRQKVFTQKMLSSEMNIYNAVRESCDSAEHPNAFPIILALDVTGSMGRIPYELITGAFPEIMKNIMEAGVRDAQICFVAIGDDCYDAAPIQCGQFETSDELTEKWLKKIYIESGGGPNYGESYGFAWYFAARHTKIDSFLKHNKKGCLITVGDEPILKTYSKHSIQSNFGDTVQDDVHIESLYEEASEQWHIYHINAGGRSTYWDILPKEHLLNAGRDINSISKEIINAILESYNQVQEKTINSTETSVTPQLHLL